MKKLIATEYVTLDGVMEAPGSEDSLGALSGWSFRYSCPEISEFKFAELRSVDALLLGRATYEIFADSWPSATDDKGFAERMNALPKYVASTTLDALTWNNSSLISADVEGSVSKLKEQDGQDILVYGSADLVGSLMEFDLIDEYRLMMFPLVLGTGKRLFADHVQASLDLVSTATLPNGVVILTYLPSRTSNSQGANNEQD